MSVTVITEAQRVALNNMNDVSKDISLGSVLQNTQTQANVGGGSLSVAFDTTSTGALDDYAYTASLMLFTNAVTTISGFAAGSDGETLYVARSNGDPLTLLYNDSGSAAGNRMITAFSVNRRLAVGEATFFVYSSSLAAWIEMSTRPRVGALAEYADNTAADAAGLLVGELYRTGDALKVVHA